MVEQFCRSILQLGIGKSKSIVNLIMGLASQTNAKSVVEVSLNPCYHFQYSSISKAIDSIYEKAPDTIILKDLDFKRNININNTGNNAEVVWNPWIDGAQECVDMHDDGYQTMICIESAVLAPRGQLVEPSSRHIFSTKLLGTSLT